MSKSKVKVKARLLSQGESEVHGVAIATPTGELQQGRAKNWGNKSKG